VKWVQHVGWLEFTAIQKKALLAIPLSRPSRYRTRSSKRKPQAERPSIKLHANSYNLKIQRAILACMWL
jgi:hypothetical protein